MSDPYRTSSGLPCLRCGVPLAEGERGALVCSGACGTWLPALSVRELLGTSDLGEFKGRIAYWKATPLEPVSCPRCERALDPHYMPMLDGDILTLGCCVAHGVWMDHYTRDDFVDTYAQWIEAHQRAVQQASTAPADRIGVLEQRVTDLERQVAELQAHLRQQR